jgi:long-chain fatty acid transport protein
MKRTIRLILLLCIPASALYGQGFRMNAQGIKAMAYGGYAAIGLMDASAAYYNPASISRLEKSQMTTGIGVVFPRISYLSPYSGNEDMDPALSLPFHLHGVVKMNGKLSAGVSLNTPFTEHTSWDDWSGKYITTEYRYRSLNLQPVISYAVSEKFSVGGGPVLNWASLKRTYALDVASAGSAYGIAEEKSAAVAFGYTLSFHADAGAFSAGAVYRSSSKLKMENGSADFSDVSEGSAILEEIPVSADFKTEIIQPSSVDAGMALAIGQTFEVMINGSMVFWSDAEKIEVLYDAFPNLNSSTVLNYKDALSITGSGKYRYTEKMTFRAGAGFVKSHVEDGSVHPASPDADQFRYSGGITWTKKPTLSFDLSFMICDYKSRKETGNRIGNFNGDYKSTLYIAGIGVNYEF